MRAVYAREWRSFFYSPKGFVFAAVFLALCSFYFINGALIYQSADLSIVFSNINVVYLFLVSILTMGLFSNERSQKTDQLLLTSSVSITKIVWGKFLGAVTVFGITLAMSLIYPIILLIFGNPSIMEMAGSYTGFILLWSAFIAIGMFISSTTENQLISAVATFGVLLVVFYLNTFAAGISNETLRSVVRWFSLMDKYAEFRTGILNLESVVYYISFVLVFVFLTAQLIRRRQHSDAKVRANNAIVTMTVIFALVLVNITISVLATKVSLKFDMTRERVYEYSEQTREILESLKNDVELYALYPEDADSSYTDTIREYLTRYERMSGRIKVIYKDPYEEPAFVRQYGEDISVGSIIAVSGNRSRVVPFEKLYLQSQTSGTVSIDAEKQLTTAIGFVGGLEKAKNAYFVKGHNEYGGVDSVLATELENAGYTVGEINIAKDGIPEDTDLIIALAPSVDLTAEERDDLDEFLLNGGKAAFVLPAGIQPMERLYSYLAEWGITMNNDFAFENDPSYAYRSQSGIPIPAPQLQKHRITEKLIEGDLAFIAPNSCSLTLSSDNAQNTLVTPLLMTSENSWGITDLSTTNLDKKDGDISGPLVLSAVSEKTSIDGGKILVLGSLQAVEAQGVMTESTYCNGDFIMNSLSYLTNKGDVLSIRAKKFSAETLSMTEKQFKVTSVVIQYVIPLLILLAGFGVWIKRRNR